MVSVMRKIIQRPVSTLYHRQQQRLPPQPLLSLPPPQDLSVLAEVYSAIQQIAPSTTHVAALILPWRGRVSSLDGRFTRSICSVYKQAMSGVMEQDRLHRQPPPQPRPPQLPDPQRRVAGSVREKACDSGTIMTVLFTTTATMATEDWSAVHLELCITPATLLVTMLSM